MNKIYFKKQPVKIGDEVIVNGVTLEVNNTNIENNPDLFEVVDRSLLLQEAREKFPTGTKFISVSNPGTIRTVEEDNHFPDNHNIYCGSTPSDEWGYEGVSNPILYKDGQWAEIIEPAFTNHAGIDFYKYDEVYILELSDMKIHYHGKGWLKHWTPTPDRNLAFATREAAEAYIAKHKEKTLENYIHKAIDEDPAVMAKLKQRYPKLFYTHVLQKIADDLNGDKNIDFNVQNCVYNLSSSGPNSPCGDSEGCVYFYDIEKAQKAIEIMGDKLHIIFKH